MDRRDRLLDMEMGTVSPRPHNVSPGTSAPSSRAPSPPLERVSQRHVYKSVRRGSKDYDDNDTQSVITPTITRTSTFAVGVGMRPHWYSKVSPIVRWCFNVLPFAAVLAIPLALFATVFRDVTFSGVRALGFFVWLEAAWLSLWLLRFLAMGVPTIFKLFFGTASQTNRIYHRTLSRIPFAIALVVWSVAAEMSIVPVMMIFDDGTLAEGIPVWIDKIQRVFRALIVISLLLLAERFTVNLVSINYKARRLEPRAYANRQHIHVLKKLYAKSIELYPPLATEASRKRFGAWDWTMETGIEADKPPCPTLLTDLRLAGEQVRGAVGKWASEAVGDTPKKIGGRPSSTVKKALEAEHTARALGKRLFYSFVYSDKEELTQVDLGHKFLSEDTAEVERMFRMIDADGNGDLTVDEMVQFCIAASDERKSLDKSATGIDEAVEILDRFLLLIVVISSVLILGAVFSQSFSMYLSMVGAQIVALSFAVSRTVFEILSACIFIFIKHPYDVGDRVDIDSQRLVVEKISLLYTVFKRIDTGKRVQISNMTLNSRWIENVSRSGNMGEVVVIEIDNETTIADMNTLQELLIERLRLPENRRDFHDDLSLELLELEGLGKFQLRFAVTHKSNWANERLRQRRRNKLLVALVASIRQVPVFGSAGWRPPLGTQFRPSYQVIVTKEQALEQQEKLKKIMKEDRHRDAVEDDVEFISHLATATGWDSGSRASGGSPASMLRFRGDAK